MFAKKNLKRSDSIAVVDDEAETRKSTLLRRITSRKAKAETKAVAEPDVKPKEIFIGDPNNPPESDSDVSDESSEDELEVNLDEVFSVVEEVAAVQKQAAPAGVKKKTKNGSSPSKIGRPKKTDQEREDERIKEEKRSRLLEARRVRAANARKARQQANIDDFQARAREFVAEENRRLAEQKRLDEIRIDKLASERVKTIIGNKEQPLTVEIPQRPRKKFIYR